MTSLRAALLLSILTVAAVTTADVHVRAVASPGAERCLSELTLLTHTHAKPTRTPFPKGIATLTVPLSGTDRISVRAEAPGCWSETAETASSSSEIVVRLYNAVHARGTFEADHGQWPETLEGAAFPPPDGGTRAIASAENGQPVDCKFDQPAWDCVIPANAPMDLRLRPTGFAPVYYWDIATRDDITLEPRPLRKGASISGWVEGVNRKPIEGARITIGPAVQARNDGARQAAAEATGRTNRRGFFQINGLAEGEYQLVSRTDGLPPVVLPVVRLRAAEALIWPRQIVHQPYAELSVTLTPPRDNDERPWYVAVEEVSPLATPPPQVRHAATLDGMWTERSLRNDLYRVRVEDEDRSVLETFVVDLSGGGTTHVPVSVVRKMVRGVLRFGADPLSAQIRFSTPGGRSVQTKTTADGHFELSFPIAGTWTPLVLPDGPNGPRIQAKAIVVPDTEEDHAIDVILGGGRLRGSVVTPDGHKEKAAVHVERSGKLIAQLSTDKDGTFDFIGIDEGDYTISAEGNSGSTRKQTATIADGETVEITLRLEPYRRVTALVLTPSRSPASGAIVRVSTDRGLSWTDLFTSIDGTFEYFLDGSDESLLAVVLTHAYPAILTELRPSAGVTLMLPPQGGLLRVAYPSFVFKGPALAPMKMLMVPPSRNGIYNGAALLEPGLYSVCPSLAMTSQCRSVTISAGTETTIEAPASEKPTR